MTIKELTEELSYYPENTIVVVHGDDGYLMPRPSQKLHTYLVDYWDGKSFINVPANVHIVTL